MIQGEFDVRVGTDILVRPRANAVRPYGVDAEFRGEPDARPYGWHCPYRLQQNRLAFFFYICYIIHKGTAQIQIAVSCAFFKEFYKRGEKHGF